jgi:hypothetical protein
MPSPKKKPVVQEEPKFTKKLPVKLTPREIAEKKDRHFVLSAEEKAKRSELSLLGAPIRERIREIVAEGDELLKQVGKGTEEREVSCTWKRDYTAGEVWAIRIDTREEVPETRRTMTADERQETFPNVTPLRGKRGKVNDLDAEVPPPAE